MLSLSFIHLVQSVLHEMLVTMVEIHELIAISMMKLQNQQPKCVQYNVTLQTTLQRCARQLNYYKYNKHSYVSAATYLVSASTLIPPLKSCAVRVSE